MKNIYSLNCISFFKILVILLGIFSCKQSKKENTQTDIFTSGNKHQHTWFCHDRDRMQSPINIKSFMTKEGHHMIHFHYAKPKEHIHKSGRTIKVDYDSGGNLDFDNIIYELKQFHFHTPSEHLLDDQRFPLELHIVHISPEDSNKYLVIGLLFEEGEANPTVDEFLNTTPFLSENEDLVNVIDIKDVFTSEDSMYYFYQGSLTTPPYTEGVKWCVYKKIHKVSKEQIERLKKIQGNNARDIQSQNKRVIESS